MRMGVTGHQQIPSDALACIQRSIRQCLQSESPPVIGLSSLAAGADQLFASCLLELGGHLHVVVPSAHYDETFPTMESRQSYYHYLAKASDIIEMDEPSPSERAFFNAGCKIVDLSDKMIAIWDGNAARGFGGTADVVAYARKLGRPLEIIWREDSADSPRGR